MLFIFMEYFFRLDKVLKYKINVLDHQNPMSPLLCFHSIEKDQRWYWKVEFNQIQMVKVMYLDLLVFEQYFFRTRINNTNIFLSFSLIELHFQLMKCWNKRHVWIKHYKDVIFPYKQFSNLYKGLSTLLYVNFKVLDCSLNENTGIQFSIPLVINSMMVRTNRICTEEKFWLAIDKFSVIEHMFFLELEATFLK